MIQTWVCAAPDCGSEFTRYRSQVRNPERPFCSHSCANRVNGLGTNNANYRHGKYFEPSFCECGKQKDFRSRCCAVCARVSYPAGGQVRELPTADEIANAIKTASDLASAALSLALSRQVLTRLARAADLDFSHMKAGRGRPTHFERVFVLREARASALVRAALLRLEPENYFCENCGMGPEWMGIPITLELDHINGSPFDDRRDNLRWLCPNCHSQTSTFRGKKRKEEYEQGVV